MITQGERETKVVGGRKVELELNLPSLPSSQHVTTLETSTRQHFNPDTVPTRMASSSSFSANLSEARSLTHRANVHLSGSSPELAFPLYLQAAELYSLTVRQATPNSPEKTKVRKEWADVLATADKVKRILRSSQGEGSVRVGHGKARSDRGQHPSANDRKIDV